MRFIRTSAIVVLLLCAGAKSYAQVPIPLTINGNEATGVIQLASFVADLSIAFEQADGLTTDALTVTARVVSPFDTTVISRLPQGVWLTLGLPVLVQIEAPGDGGLSFHGITTVSLHTHNLPFLPSLPLFLHSAEYGGAFHDVTSWNGPGSYHVGGSDGTFCEFLIVLDLRPVNAIINGKYTALQQLINAHGPTLPPEVTADLQARLSDSQALFQAGQTEDAIDALDGFSGAVIAGSGTTIPDVFSADGSTVNVAGLLRAAAATLRFSLVWKSTH
jgi:hypothetical protein